MEGNYPYYGGKPPHVNQQTSEDAADAIEAIAPTVRLKVYKFIIACGVHGATDDECQFGIPLHPNTQTPRRRELVQDGTVIQSGRKRRTRRGSWANVWIGVEFKDVEIPDEHRNDSD